MGSIPPEVEWYVIIFANACDRRGTPQQTIVSMIYQSPHIHREVGKEKTHLLHVQYNEPDLNNNYVTDVLCFGIPYRERDGMIEMISWRIIPRRG